MENTAEKILNQHQKFSLILSKVCDKEAVEKLIEFFGERIAMAPRSTKHEDGGYPGALLEFSLNVASVSKSISESFNCDVKSLVKVSLLHEIGRIGDLENDFYLEQDSEWHREKLGQHYKYNEKCLKMGISHRTLWILNHFGFSLTQEEYLAILTSQGLHLDENKFYGFDASKNPLIVSLQASRGIVLQSNN